MWVAFADIGQTQDYGALGLIQHVIEGDSLHPESATDHFVLRYVRRLPMKTEYEEMLRQIDRLTKIPEARGDIEAVIDGNGCGRPLIERSKKMGMNIKAISATGGNKEGGEPSWLTVPKVDLVQGLIISMETGRFHVATTLPPGADSDQIMEFQETMKHLRREMQDLKMTVNKKTLHIGFEAGHENIHDDMIMGICIGLYWLKKHSVLIEDIITEEKEEPFNELTFGMK